MKGWPRNIPPELFPAYWGHQRHWKQQDKRSKRYVTEVAELMLSAIFFPTPAPAAPTQGAPTPGQEGAFLSLAPSGFCSLRSPANPSGE